MEKEYKYEKFTPEYYNITSKLIDATVEKGFGDKIAVTIRTKPTPTKKCRA